MHNLTKEQLDDIAQDLEADFECFYHKPTGEVLRFMSGPNDYDEKIDDEDNLWLQDSKKVADNPDDYEQIEPITSHDSYRFMQDFVDSLPENLPIRRRLANALQKKGPFRQFRDVLDNDNDVVDYLAAWYAFKKEAAIAWVDKRIRWILGEDEIEEDDYDQED